jgi:hypothetical protein
LDLEHGFSASIVVLRLGEGRHAYWIVRPNRRGSSTPLPSWLLLDKPANEERMAQNIRPAAAASELKTRAKGGYWR